MPTIDPVKLTAARVAKAAERRASPLRRDFLDSAEWDRLARRYGVRLPPWGQAPTPSVILNFLKRVGVSLADYYAWSGTRRREAFALANPTWPARAWAGLVLEALDGGQLSGRAAQSDEGVGA